jgi:acyl carrier protein
MRVVGSPDARPLIDKRLSVRKGLVGIPCRVGAMTQDQILEFCVVSLANVLRVPKDVIQIDTKFSRLGLDSAMTVYLQMELEDKLGLELSPDNFYDYPTVDKLSRHLSQLYGARPAA